MSKIDYINHKGVVIEADINGLSVEILNASACSGCHAKGACTMADVKSKIIEVENNGYDVFEVGEEVNVKLKRTMGYRALWISYLIPLIILLLLLVSLSTLGFSEPFVGLGIIGGITLYYLIIWLLKDKLKRDFVFIVEKLNK